jgi:Protein of unknown function (DUF3800)
MTVLHSFFDESGKFKDHRVVAFCGFGASPTQLKDFDAQWENQLRRTGMDALHWVDARRYGKPLSKKIGPQTLTERINELRPFADCVNDYLGLGAACVFEVVGYTAFALESKALLGNTENPFYIQFLRTMLLLAEYAKSDERITMTCDEDEGTAWNCYRFYKQVKKVHRDIRKRFGAITFADDIHFPALQAADMLSFLCREQANLQFYGERYEYEDFFWYLTNPRGTSSLEWRVAFKNKVDLKRLDDTLAAKAAKQVEPNVKKRAERSAKVRRRGKNSDVGIAQRNTKARRGMAPQA